MMVMIMPAMTAMMRATAMMTTMMMMARMMRKSLTRMENKI